MALKFRKTYSLAVDLAQGAANVAASAGKLSTTSSNIGAAIPGSASSVTIRPPFTLDFDVQRAHLADANCADFTAHGLGPSLRKSLYKDLYNTAEADLRSVEFWGGYKPPPTNVKLTLAQSTNPGQLAAEATALYTLLFRGNVYRAYSDRDGGAWRTRIECQTGNYAYQHAHSSRSYSAGTPKRQIILDLISDLPNLRLGAVGDFPGSISRGHSYSGSSLEYIKELTDGHFYVDNERVFCLNDNEYIPGSVPVISAASGLVGAPRREQTFVTARMMFEPGLLIGQAVQLKSVAVPEANGTYKITGLTHQGTISDAIASSVFTTVTMTNYDPLTVEVPLL